MATPLPNNNFNPLEFGATPISNKPTNSGFSGQPEKGFDPFALGATKLEEPKSKKSIPRKVAEFLAPTTVGSYEKIKAGEKLTPRDFFGSALEIGSFALPTGAVARTGVAGARLAGLARLGKPAVAKTLAESVRLSAGIGAGSGAMFEAGRAIGEEDTTIGQVASRTAGGAVGGGVFGAAFPVAGRLAAKTVTPISDAIRSMGGQITTPMINRAKTAQLNDFRTLIKNTAGTETKYQKSIKSGKDPAEVMVKYNLMPERTVADNRSIKTDFTVAFNKTFDYVKELAEAQKEIAQYARQRVGIPEFVDRADSILKKYSNSLEYMTNKSKLDQSISSFLESKRVSSKGLTANNIIDLLVDANRKYDPNVPYIRNVDEAIGDAAREYLNKIMPGDDLSRRLRSEMGDLIDARKMIDPTKGGTLHNRPVKSGVLSRLAARGTGAIIGASAGAGPIGAVIGAIGGDAIATIVQKFSISNPIRQKILDAIKRDSSLLDEAIRTAKSLPARNLLESIRETQLRLNTPALPAPTNLPAVRPATELPGEGILSGQARLREAESLVPPIAPVGRVNQVENLLNRSGYEPYVPPEQLPIIKMGPKPKPRSDLPVIDLDKGKVTKGSPSQPPAQAFGAVAGFEKDEEGGIKFSPEKAALGVVGVAGLTRVTKGKGADDIFKGLKNLSTKLVEKFKGLPNEITPQKFNEVINKAQKEGVRKADLDLVKEMAAAQSKQAEAISIASDIGKVSQQDSIKQIGDLIKKPIEGKINLTRLAKDVETQLVPLTPTPVKSPRWSNVGEDFIGDGKYGEIVYQSPIKTRAGDVHFQAPQFGNELQLLSQAERRTMDTLNTAKRLGERLTKSQETELARLIEKTKEKGFPNYFSHVRYEDVPVKNVPKIVGYVDSRVLREYDRLAKQGKTRKILEVQSDLFQKENFEREVSSIGLKGEGLTSQMRKRNDELAKKYINGTITDAEKLEWKKITEARNLPQVKSKRQQELSKLQPYSSNDPLAHLRTFREEVKRAAKDGKDTLLIPSGETAMKIEGLNQDITQWWQTTKTGTMTDTPLSVDSLKLGSQIAKDQDASRWIITDVLGDGKFKAVPQKQIIEIYRDVNDTLEMPSTKKILEFLVDEPNHGLSETFDISGKVDTKHFVYKLNEEAIPREARKMGLEVEGNYQIPGFEEEGVWWKIKIPKERAKMPTEAFGALPFTAGVSQLLGRDQK